MIKQSMNITEKLISDFKANETLVLSGSTDSIKKTRIDAFESFKKQGMPTIHDEEWRFTDISDHIKPEYIYQFEHSKNEIELKDIFRCDVPDLNTIVITLMNGWFPTNFAPELPDGIIICSMADAINKYPELVNKHFANHQNYKENGLIALNTAFARDGIFIYIPDNVVFESPIQFINVVHSTEDLIIHQRNMIIAGKNSQVTVVVCDHSLFFNKSFVNSVTEVVAEENAKVNIYNIQNSSNNTSMFSSTNIIQKKYSSVLANTITLHGGFIRNNTHVLMDEEFCEVNLFGLYLTDREQHVDNHTVIEHAKPNCTSNEKYKGILNEQSKCVFNGKVLVHKDAQKTNAFQSNNNILMTDEAKINSQPQLEIYADDVKCSHGATTGQLDKEALFYLRSRGINEDEARMMLMYSFAVEIINKIKIGRLRDRIDDLVSKRLRGELSRCNNCMVKCY